MCSENENEYGGGEETVTVSSNESLSISKLHLGNFTDEACYFMFCCYYEVDEPISVLMKSKWNDNARPRIHYSSFHYIDQTENCKYFFQQMYY